MILILLCLFFIFTLILPQWRIDTYEKHLRKIDSVFEFLFIVWSLKIFLLITISKKQRKTLNIYFRNLKTRVHLFFPKNIEREYCLNQIHIIEKYSMKNFITIIIILLLCIFIYKDT